jgi:1-phosphatidylinositol-4-phosphate 5-kinase
VRTFHLPPPGGGFFFFSSDGRYLLKTLARREQRKLMRILPAYFNHLLRAPRTLLARLFGCYSITMHGQTRYFVVMASLFHGVAKIHEKYDLKGSWIDRSMRAPGSSPEESSATRLDNDLARKVKLPRREAARLAAQCARDAELLRSLNIMDYSLLLGVRLLAPAYRAPPATGGAAGAEAEPAGAAGTAAAAAGGTEGMEPWRDGPLVWTSEDGSAVYYVTIIDLLQSWNLLKRLERLFKRAMCCRWRPDLAAGMSVVEPAHYAKRFNRMVARILAMDRPRSSGADCLSPPEQAKSMAKTWPARGMTRIHLERHSGVQAMTSPCDL